MAVMLTDEIIEHKKQFGEDYGETSTGEDCPYQNITLCQECNDEFLCMWNEFMEGD